MRFLLSFSGQNIKQWRWRLLSIALLVAVTFTLHVLYASFLESARSNTLRAVSELALPYDLLVVVKPRERILSKEELPPLPVISQRLETLEMIALMEPVVHLVANSAYGSFSVLGVPDDSNIYSSLRIEYEGSWLTSSGEIILPRQIAESEKLTIGCTIDLSTIENPGQWGIHHRNFKLVGVYEPQANGLPKALMLYEDALTLTGSTQPNACLFTYPRNFGRDNRRIIDIARFTDWLRPAYPKAQFISASTPEVLSAKLLGTIYQPGSALLFLIVVFAFVGVTTVAIMTYLERRREFAAVKTLGMSRRQLIAIFTIEYGVAEVVGLGLGAAALLIFGSRIDWVSSLEGSLVIRLAFAAGFFSLATVILAVLYPVATALVASVNQLLYARRIPFGNMSTDHLENPTSEQVYRERAENVRLLKLIAIEGAENDILLMKSVGERVKKGETVALQERAFGYVIFEWKALCDGEVISIDSGGLIGIRPDDENEAFFPYPKRLLEVEERRRKAYKKA